MGPALQCRNYTHTHTHTHANSEYDLWPQISSTTILISASKQYHCIPNTISERRSQKDEPDTTMIDVEQVLANEEQPYTGMSKKTQDFPSQLFTLASPPRSANERRAFNSGPPPGSNHRFRMTFGPVTSIDADGTMINVPHHSQG